MVFFKITVNLIQEIKNCKVQIHTSDIMHDFLQNNSESHTRNEELQTCIDQGVYYRRISDIMHGFLQNISESSTRNVEFKSVLNKLQSTNTHLGYHS